jgi:hypothetical protein
MRVFLNLRKGLDLLGVPYRVNDFRHALRNPEELACIVGKPCVLEVIPWKNPILFGAAIYSHPVDDPRLLERLPIRKILVPGPWMREMCRPAWGKAVEAWPVGIDSELWRPAPTTSKSVDVLLYDKVRWNREQREVELIAPIRARLRREGRSVAEIRYGRYREEEFRSLLAKARSMLFLCESETQGIAYQQALSSGVPIFAWDEGGAWADPAYYPEKVVFSPVSSVPYWDRRCGVKFTDLGEFESRWSAFWGGVAREEFSPRDYVLDHLTLDKCTGDYVAIANRTATGGS